MAKLLQTTVYFPNRSRFQVISTYHNTMFVADTVENRKHLIDCVTRNAMHAMACWNDAQWLEWFAGRGVAS